MNSPMLVLYYLPTSAYALNVLLGALEHENLDQEVELRLPRRLADLHAALGEANEDSRDVLVLWSFFSASFEVAKSDLGSTLEAFPSKNVRHIAGGVHASAEPHQTLMAGFDYVAIGEGEATVVELVRKLLAGGDISSVAGLSRIEGGELVASSPAPRFSLDKYPPFAVRNRRFNPIEITRGCIYACKFCQTPFMFKARFRHRSVENIVSYVHIMRERGLRDVRFISPTSLSYGSSDENPDLDAVDHLLSSVRQAIGPEGKIFFGSFPSEIRPEHASQRAFETLKKYVDNDNVIIGAQSGSEKVLSDSKRGHNVEVIEQAVRYAIEGGFTANVDFIFGLPGETEKDAEESIRLANRLAKIGARIHGHTFMPLPGTPYKDEAPGTFFKKTQLELERLTSRGRLYGKWRQQVEIAERMSGQQAEAKTVRSSMKFRRPRNDERG